MNPVLLNLLENVHSHVGKGTNRGVVQGSLVNLGWMLVQYKVSEECKKTISDWKSLASLKKSERLCIFTNPSESPWSGIIMQVQRYKLSVLHATHTALTTGILLRSLFRHATRMVHPQNRSFRSTSIEKSH